MSFVPSLRNEEEYRYRLAAGLKVKKTKKVTKKVTMGKKKAARPANQKFTDPQINTSKKNWFVWFRFYDVPNSKWVLIRRNGKGINWEGRPKGERLKDLQALQKAILIKLRDQYWNPLTDTYETEALTAEQEIDRMKFMAFNDALAFAVKKKSPDWSKKTGQDYASVVKYLSQGATAAALGSTPISDFDLVHYKLVMEATQKLRKLSAKGYNKYREYLSSLVGELVQWQVVKLNYVHHLASKATIKAMAHRPPTQDQQRVIVQHLSTRHREFYRFVAVLYACTIREKEILALRVRDLHRREQIFRITPDKDRENSKVKIERDIIIPDSLLVLLSELNLHNYPLDYYIFSKGYTPGPVGLHSNTPRDQWRRVVKDPKKGLGIDVDMYGLKKAGGNQMVKLQKITGTDKLLDLPRRQMGHTTEKMTEVYVTEHTDIITELFKTQMPLL